MVEHFNSSKAVCEGSTLTDQLTSLTDNRIPRAGQVETIYTDSGMGLQMFTQLPHTPDVGDQEFPFNRSASNLVTKDKEGEKLTGDEKKALAGYREYPNSESMGYFAGLQKQGRLTTEQSAEFMADKREAGCIRPAKVHHDGSIEFHKH